MPRLNRALLAVALAGVAAVGVVAVDGYGMSWDQPIQYRVGHSAVQYALRESNALLREDHRYYGALFEVALQIPERLLGLSDTHHIYLARYLASHLFFLAGGLACHLLAHRLFGSRALAWFALAFYLLHPRLYAHSFFNSKDTPFLSMVMIGLWLTHWAFAKRGVGAWALLGGWMGAATSIRPVGAVVLALALGGLLHGGRHDAPRRLACAAALLGAAAAGFFAGLPYLWPDPIGRFAEWFAFVSDHPNTASGLFMGAWVDGRDRPLAYLPVWMSITTPPFILALAALGVGAWLTRIAARPRHLLAHTRLRFEGLLLAAFFAPALLLAAWVGNIYDGWRHAQFLYAPVCLFAAAGLGWLAQRGRRLRVCVYGVAAMAVGGVVCALVLLHPNQQVYFNYFVDRTTPDQLWRRYEMDYWRVALKQGHRALLRSHPHGDIPISGLLTYGWRTLPAAERERFVVSNDFAAFYSVNLEALLRETGRAGGTSPPLTHVGEVYGSPVYALARSAVAEDGPWRAHWANYRSVGPGTPAARSRFAVYWDGRVLSLARERCRPSDVQDQFFLRMARRDGPAVAGGASAGQDGWDFWFRHRGVVLRGERADVCLVRIDLSGYAPDAVRTGQVDQQGESMWEVAFAVDAQHGGNRPGGGDEGI